MEALDGVGAVKIHVTLPQSGQGEAAPAAGRPTSSVPGLGPGSVPAPTPKSGILGEDTRVLAVSSGKGGVGKSTLAVNLALTLSAMGLSTGLLDGDLSAPDLPHLLGIHPQQAPRGFGWELMSKKVKPLSQRNEPYRQFDVELMSS